MNATGHMRAAAGHGECRLQAAVFPGQQYCTCEPAGRAPFITTPPAGPWHAVFVSPPGRSRAPRAGDSTYICASVGAGHAVFASPQGERRLLPPRLPNRTAFVSPPGRARSISTATPQAAFNINRCTCRSSSTHVRILPSDRHSTPKPCPLIQGRLDLMRVFSSRLFYLANRNWLQTRAIQSPAGQGAGGLCASELNQQTTSYIIVVAHCPPRLIMPRRMPRHTSPLDKFSCTP